MQSLVVNSNFDMQLQGDLGNGLKIIIAAISDANLPIQIKVIRSNYKSLIRCLFQVE